MSKSKHIPRILVVAGSDSGGGAGIQADIKTVMALGGFAGTTITALTAQNTLGVAEIHPVPNTFVAAQMVSFLEDIGADAIKLGMLYDENIIRMVTTVLTTHSPNIPVFLDPVMIAKGGAHLLKPEAVAALEKLYPRARLVTPNIPEAEAMTGRRITSPQTMLEAANTLLEKGPEAVFLKGGHLEGAEIYEVLVQHGEKEIWFKSTRLLSPNTHGTGCTLASAIATLYPKLGGNLALAVGRAREYVRLAIQKAPGFGQGHGPLWHANVPEVERA